MVRSSQSTSMTASFSPYFYDRGPYGTAQPITDRIHPHYVPKVSYYYPKGVGSFHYGEKHPMKPARLSLTNALVMGYGLDKRIHEIYDARPASKEELEAYHDSDYVDFLSRVLPQVQPEFKPKLEEFNCSENSEDCPIFSEIFDFCKMYAGGSITAARKLCAGTTDIAINWSGGLHHAQRGKASGFCYVNDIVLAVLELLRYHPRVLYIDIDIHHGDGVEFAFYQSDRVMTVSFHKYTGEFFPCTGKFDDTGSRTGKNFCVNVPLLDGIDDKMYLELFKSVIGDVVEAFNPSCIVLQCGADSLGCDRLGAFNLSIRAHGECVAFVRSFNRPLLVLGGGGYTIKNVSRCWTYETGVLVGYELPEELPRTVYDSFFEDSHWKLHPSLTGKIENQNSKSALHKMASVIRTRLRYLQGAPSVQMQEIPPNIQRILEDEEKNAEEADEAKGTAKAGEKRKDTSSARNEYYDGDKDNDFITEVPAQKKTKPRRAAAAKPRASTGTTDGEDEEEPQKPKARRKSRSSRNIGARRKGGSRRARRTSIVEKEKEVAENSKEATPAETGGSASKEPSATPLRESEAGDVMVEPENGSEEDDMYLPENTGSWTRRQ